MAQPDASPSRIRRGIGLVFLLGLLIWVSFFDSHSLMKRLRWHQEYTQLKQENAALHREIGQLETKLERPPSDATIEKIAREQYGMQREGETIYRIDDE